MRAGVLNVLGDLFGVVLKLVAIFTIVGVVRQMHPRVMGVSYHVIAPRVWAWPAVS